MPNFFIINDKNQEKEFHEENDVKTEKVLHPSKPGNKNKEFILMKKKNSVDYETYSKNENYTDSDFEQY